MNTRMRVGFVTLASAATLALTCMGMARSPEPAQVNASRIDDDQCAPVYTSCFDGTSLPGHGGAPSAFWDNPVDDDWKEAGFRSRVWLINQKDAASGETYMRVDRTDVDGPGWIMRRDPAITPQTGVKIDLIVRVPESSTQDGLALIYIDRIYHFAVGLESGGIVLNPVGNQRGSERGQFVPVDLQSGFRHLQIVRKPDSNIVQVRTGGQTPKLLIEGQASTKQRKRGEPGYITRISLGDNQDDYRSALGKDGKLRAARGILDLGFVGWHPVQPTSAGQQPDPHGQATHASKPWVWHPPVNKRRLGSGKSDVPLGLIDSRQPLLLEWRFRFAKSVPDGFHLSWLDGEYSYSIVAFDDHIQAKLYGKPVGSAPQSPEGWQPDEWTCLRLHRPAGSHHAYLYLNEDTDPIMGPIVGGSSGRRTAMVIFGGNTVPADPETAWQPNRFGQALPALGQYGVPVQVELVKVSRAEPGDVAACQG